MNECSGSAMLCDMLVAHYEEIIMPDLIFFLSPPDMSIKMKEWVYWFSRVVECFLSLLEYSLS